MNREQGYACRLADLFIWPVNILGKYRQLTSQQNCQVYDQTINIKMGQPLATCCNPNTHPSQHEIQIESYSKEAIVIPPGTLRPVSQLKQVEKSLEETLHTAVKFRTANPTSSSENGDNRFWTIETGSEENESEVIYCRGSLHNNELEGETTIYFPRGQIFEGKVVSRQPVEGAFVFKKGCFYVGDMAQFNAEGQGRYENHDSGYIYEGHWSKSLPHGEGKETYKNGDVYEGEIMYGEKFGHGVYRFADGKIYDGTFYYNQSDGRGKMKYPNLSHYEGEWKLGKFHGRGVFRWPNGENYEGEYSDGLRQGKGRYSFRNGSYYDGDWEAGLQSGRGLFHEGYDDIEGEWAEGELVS